MGIPLEALESQVLRLHTAERKRLLDRVVASLDTDAARDAAWDAIAATREAEATKNPALLVPLDEVLKQLRAELE
ncbi:MAG: hypothetical protein EXR27_07565 [Betaproteobacteria bacterium]|nr:hypothetical protein [Betaproteobacteria bacterium]